MNDKEYDNRALVIPYYSKEMISDYNVELSYPFNCDFMIYDKNQHMYFLTEESLPNFGVSVSQENAAEVIYNTSSAVYSAIEVKAGKSNYAQMMYRIAKGLGAPNLSRLSFRTKFMVGILAAQAKSIAKYGYAKDIPKVVYGDNGRVRAADLATSDLYWLNDDVIASLYALNLTNHQRVIDYRGIEWNKY